MMSRRILFVTGLSGAGISTALKALEDAGYEVFDNCPLTQIAPLIHEKGYEDRSLAFGVDTRTRAFSPDRLIQMARELGGSILFLNATNAELQKRFSETRRVHPMARDRTVTDGIIHERQILEPLITAADHTIDTTDMGVHDFKRMVETGFALHPGGPGRLGVAVMSFAYKKGVPREVDMVIDVRFLKNPHWVAALRPLTGQAEGVRRHIETDPHFAVFMEKITEDILWLLPRYAMEGKSYFTIGFGCTGGKHRSVYVAELIADAVRKAGFQVTLRHRDMPASQGH